jgi:hypothetical protein
MNDSIFDTVDELGCPIDRCLILMNASLASN